MVPDNSISTAKIQDGSVTLAKLAADSVDSSKIVNDSIVNADVKTDAAIDISKISGGVTSATVGNLLTANQASVETGVAGDNNSIDGHYPMFASCTVAHSTSQYLVGTGSLEVTAAATDFYVGHGYPATAAVTPGQTITGMFSVKSTGVVANFSVGFRWLTAGGATITDVGSQAIPSTSSWGRRIFTVVVPDTAASVWMYVIGGAATTSSVHYLDCFSLHLGAGGQWALPGTPITNLGFYTDESVGRRLFQWDANNSRWQMTYGDTGWRNITADLAGASTTADPNAEVHIRRVNDRVEIRLARGASGTWTSGTIYTLPDAFRSLPAGVLGHVAVTGLMDYGTAQETAATLWTATTIAGLETNGWSATNDYRGHLTYSTNSAWPTTLPGTAVGSIPA